MERRTQKKIRKEAVTPPLDPSPQRGGEKPLRTSLKAAEDLSKSRRGPL